jgi:GAF domain-containing protein/CheY-like chemotaxis protein
MSAEPTKVLLVDNQVSARDWMAEFLIQRGFDVSTAADGEESLARVSASNGDIDVIVMDLFLGSGRNGIETMKTIKQQYPTIETIIITGFNNTEDSLNAIREGAYRYVVKPFLFDELTVYIERAAEKKKLDSEISRAKIYETFTALRRGLDLGVILDGIVKNLQGLFELETCTIGLLDAKETQLEIMAERGLGTKFVKPLSELPKDFKKVFQHDRPLEIGDLDDRPDWKASLLRHDLKSLTLLPLKNTAGDSLGVISMGRVHRTPPSSDDEGRLLMGLADQASIAIENARLHEQTKRRAELHAALEDASLDIVEVGVNQVLRRIIERAAGMLQASGGTIYLFTPDDKKLMVKASFGKPYIDERTIITKESGVVGEVIRTRKPFSKADYGNWPGRQKQFDHLGLQAVMGVPIFSRETLLGVLAHHHTQVGQAFTADQEEFLLRFGRHAGVAIANAQMLEDQQKSGELIDALVSELGDDRLPEKILNLLKEHWPQGYCEILLRKKGTNELYVTDTHFPVKSKRTTPIKISKRKGIVAWVAATGKPRVVFDVHEERLYEKILDDIKSEIAVPLLSGGKVIGVLNVESPEVGVFDERDERVLTRLASAIALRVDHFQQFEEARLQMEQSRTLSKLTAQILAAQTVLQKLRTVARQLLSVSNGHFCLVMLPTRDGHILRVRAAEVASNRVSWGEVIEKPSSLLEIPQLSEVLLSSYRLLRADDALGEELLVEIDKLTELKQELKSILLIPLRVGAALVGLCILGEVTNGKDNPFTDQEIGSAVKLSEAAAPLIHQARLMELEQNRNQAFKDLTTVGNTVTSTLEKKDVFDLIVKFCRTLLKAEVSTIFLVSRAGYLTLESNSGSPSGTANIGLKLRIPDSKETVKCGLTGYLTAKGEIFNDYGETLHSHPAIKSIGPHAHLPSGDCQSLLVVPLKKVIAGKEEVIGLIKLENKKDQMDRVEVTRGFSEEDVLLLSTLASFAVTAIQNAEHFAFANALERVAKAVNSSIVDYSGMLERVLIELRELIPYDSASIQLLSGHVLRVKACHGFDEIAKEGVMGLSFPLITKFPNERVMRTKKSYRIDDVRSTRFEHFWKEKIYCLTDIRSWLGIPLLLGEQAIGMLSVESKQPFFYTNTDEDHGEAFASHVVPAIRNAERYKGAGSLIEITRELNKEVERSSVLQWIVNFAIDKNAIIGADKAIIYDYDAERERFNPPAVFAGGLVDPEASNPPFTPDCVAFRCIGLKKPHPARTVNDDPLLRGTFSSRERIVSAAVFPLLVDEELVGLMFVNYLSDHDFTSEEMAVTEMFAQQAAIAIKKARQYELVKARMETAVEAARIGRLATAMAHDVYAPALSIRVDANYLRDKLKDDESRKILSDIYNAAEDLSRVVPRLPETRDTEKVDLKLVVESIRKRRGEELTGRGITIESDLDNVSLVLMNKQWMEWILEKMVDNAVRSINGGGTITFTGKHSNKRILVDIIDSGPGLPAHLREQLYTGTVINPDSQGRGWSLLIIKSVLNDFNSDINYPYVDQRGNVFTIDLPLATDSEVESSGTEANSPHR